MTTEEKAKAYDEVQNKLRRFMAYGVDPLITRADVQDFFPELAESEDEKMRAMAIKAVYAPEAQSCIKSWGINPDDVIAWLKKQQKPVELSADDLPEFESYLCLMFQKFRTKGVCINGEIADFVKEHSQKLKDTLCHPWSKEDEKIYQSIMDDTVQENQLNEKQTKWLRDIKYRHFSQPQKQWKPSDEQIESLSHMIDAVESEWACEETIGRELLEQLKELRGE